MRARPSFEDPIESNGGIDKDLSRRQFLSVNCRYIRAKVEKLEVEPRRNDFCGEKSGGAIRSLGKSEEGEEKKEKERREEGKLGRGRNRARRANLFVNFRNLNVRGVSIKRRALRHVHTCTRAYSVYIYSLLERLLSSPV